MVKTLRYSISETNIYLRLQSALIYFLYNKTVIYPTKKSVFGARGLLSQYLLRLQYFVAPPNTYRYKKIRFSTHVNMTGCLYSHIAIVWGLDKIFNEYY